MKRYRTIPVNRLQIGDHVIGIDKSWLETPFLTHRFRIRSKEDIERLRASGVSMVTIEADSPEQDNPALPPPDSAEPLLLKEVSLPSYKVAEMLTSLHKYLVYKYKTLFEELRQMPESGKIDTTPFVNALEEVEKLGRQYPDAYLFLAHLQSTDDETFIHSVNTIVSLPVSRPLPGKHPGRRNSVGTFRSVSRSGESPHPPGNSPQDVPSDP